MENFKQPKVYVLVGVPGAGKSTWVANQPWAKDCVLVSTDALVEEYAASQGKTYSDVFVDYMPTAVDLMCDQVVNARAEGRDIIWDQTSTSVASRRKKFRMLSDYYHIAVVFPTPPKEELNKRLASRPGKHIPWHVVQSMIDRWEAPTEREGYKEVWYT